MSEWLVRETHNLLIADQSRNVAEFLLIRSLFLLFLEALYNAAFYRVLASVCDAKFRLCV